MEDSKVLTCDRIPCLPARVLIVLLLALRGQPSASESHVSIFPILASDPPLLLAAAAEVRSTTPPLHGWLETNAGGLYYTPRDSFWSLGSDSVTLERPAHAGGTEFVTLHLMAAFHGREILAEDFEAPSLDEERWAVDDPAGRLELTASAALEGARGLAVPAVGATLTHPPCAIAAEPCAPSRGGGEQGGGTINTWRPPPPPPRQGPAPWGAETILYTAGPPAAPLFDLRVRLTADGTYQIAASGLSLGLQGPERAFTSWVPLNTTANRIRLDAWLGQGTPGGGLRLLVDDRAVGSLNGLSNAHGRLLPQAVGSQPLLSGEGLGFDLDDVRFYRAGADFTPAEAERAELLLAEGFEGADLAAWGIKPMAETGVEVSPKAALIGRFGLAAALRSGASSFLARRIPASAALNARVRLDPSAIELPVRTAVRLFAATTTSKRGGIELWLSRRKAALALRAVVLDDRGTHHATPWVPVTAAPHTLELQWRAATGAAVSNGLARVWLDGALAAELKGLDNDAQDVNAVALGALDAPAGASGAIHFDGVEVWR